MTQQPNSSSETLGENGTHQNQLNTPHASNHSTELENINPLTELSDSEINIINTDNISQIQLTTVREENIWGEIMELKSREITHENSQELAQRYIELANIYKKFGAQRAAIAFIQKAIEHSDDPTLIRWLARVQGYATRFDFIATFEKLIDDETSIKLALEYCYFLEIRDYHHAALNVFEKTIRNRQPSIEEMRSIDGFFHLIQFHNEEASYEKVNDYKYTLQRYVSGRLIPEIKEERPTLSHTIIGKQLEEFQPDFGLIDEIKEKWLLVKFFYQNYFIVSTTITFALIILLTELLDLHPTIVANIGTSLILIIIVLSLGNLFLVLKQPPIIRSLALRQALINMNTAAVVILFLTLLDYFIFRGKFESVNPLFRRLVGIFLILSWTVTGLIYINGLKKYLATNVEKFLNEFERAYFQKSIANVVAGSAMWAGLIAFVVWTEIGRDSLTAFIFLALKCLFLVSCFRWGQLASKSHKRRQRDELKIITVCLFIAMVYWLSYRGRSILDMLMFMNFDACLIMGIMLATILEFTKIPALFTTFYIFIIFLLNLSPFMSNFGLEIYKLMFQPYVQEVSFGLLLSNMIMAILILCLTLKQGFRRIEAASLASVGEPRSMPRKPKVAQDALILGGLSAFIITLLLTLLLIGGGLGAVNLYLLLLAFLVFIGLLMPFILIYFGYIDQSTWLTTTLEALRKIPVFNFIGDRDKRAPSQHKTYESLRPDIAKDNDYAKDGKAVSDKD